MSLPTISGGHGLYDLTWESEGVLIHVSRLSTGRDGSVGGELKIEAPKLEKPHLHLSRLNLTSTRARTELAKKLDELHHTDWGAILEQLCVLVLQREREGEPLVIIRPSDEVTPPQYLVKPLVPQGQPLILFGPGGAGKGFVAVLLSLLVSSGEPHPELGLEPTRKNNVLYLDWETNEDELRWRVKRLATPLGFDDVHIHYKRCTFPLKDELEHIQRIVQEEDVGLVVVDSAGPAASGELSSPDAPISLFRALRTLDTSSLILAHTAKNSEHKTVFGSVFFGNLARSVWEVRKYQDTDEDTMAVALLHRKSNFSKLHPPIGIEFAFTDGVVEVSKAHIGCIPGAEKGLPLKGRILTLLKESGALSTRQVGEELEESVVTVRARLNELKRKGQVVKLPDGEWGVVTDVVPF